MTRSRPPAVTGPAARLCAAPCWWVTACEDDPDAPVSHHPTREAALAHHLDRVRCHYGAHLSDAEAALVVPGTVWRGARSCWERTCPDCGAVQHTDTPVTTCLDGCDTPDPDFDGDQDVDRAPGDDPGQLRLFELLPLDGLPGLAGHLVVVLTGWDDPR